jgi:hypothetical protein
MGCLSLIALSLETRARIGWRVCANLALARRKGRKLV